MLVPIPESEMERLYGKAQGVGVNGPFYAVYLGLQVRPDSRLRQDHQSLRTTEPMFDRYLSTGHQMVVGQCRHGPSPGEGVRHENICYVIRFCSEDMGGRDGSAG